MLSVIFHRIVEGRKKFLRRAAMKNPPAKNAEGFYKMKP